MILDFRISILKANPLAEVPFFDFKMPSQYGQDALPLNSSGVSRPTRSVWTFAEFA